MKKLFFIMMSLFIVAVVGCSNTSNGGQVNNNQGDQTPYDDSLEKPLLPMEMTKVDVDMNGDGEDEILRVVLLNGQKTQKNQYKGKFAIELYDKNKKQLDQTDINRNFDIILSKNFLINFKDYNGDGVLDFNVGYPNVEDEEEYVYHFYTLSEDGKLEELNIERNKTFLSSCQKGYSYDFKMNTNNTFITYDRNGGRYEYKVYRWEEDHFGVVYYMYSSVDYKDIDETLIRENIDTIAASVDSVEERDILKDYRKQYDWLLEHSEATKIYLFMNNNFDQTQDEVIGLLSNRIHQLEQINSQFNDSFKIDEIRNYSIQDIKGFKSPHGEGDYKYEDYIWKAGDKNYKLLVGEFHLDNFIFLFNESGQYLDGYIWTNKARNEVQVTFRNKQNDVTVSPIRMSYGTGTSHFGGVWFEVYKGKLIKRLEYPIQGYDAPPYTIGYTRKYESISENYNEITGDFEVTYRIGLQPYDTDELIGIEKTVLYHWDTDKEDFKQSDYGIYDQVNRWLFSPGIEDKILDKHDEKIQLVINEESNEDNKEMMEELTVFLVKCSQSKKRDRLLESLYNWYLTHDDVWNSEELIEMIKKAKPTI